MRWAWAIDDSIAGIKPLEAWDVKDSAAAFAKYRAVLDCFRRLATTAAGSNVDISSKSI